MFVGKIYFVSAPGRIKIGYTRQPEQRLASLRAVDMEELTSLGVVPGTRVLEQELHRLAQPYRIRGEWFVDCEAVRSLVAEALAGKFPVDDIEDPSLAGRTDAPVGEVASAAIQESYRLAAEIERRVKNRESVSDLVDSACFLGEHVIARLVG